MHCFGKVVNSKPIGNHDSFDVFDADQLFEGGQVAQLSMQYEIYGALVNNK